MTARRLFVRDTIRSSSARPGADELLAIVDRAAAHLQRPYADHADLLYGENGLPK